MTIGQKRNAQELTIAKHIIWKWLKGVGDAIDHSQHNCCYRTAQIIHANEINHS